MCCIRILPSLLDKTVKLWKVSERDKRPEGYNLKDEDGRLRDPSTITTLRVEKLNFPFGGQTKEDFEFYCL